MSSPTTSAPSLAPLECTGRGAPPLARREGSGHGAPSPARPGRSGRGGALRRELGVGALLAAVTVLAMVAGGSFRAAPAGATAAERPAFVLQCPLGVHRVALPGAAAER